MKTKHILIFFLFIIVFSSSACLRVVREGEVAVKRNLGKYKDKIYQPGMRLYNPLSSSFVKVNTRTTNMVYAMDLPTKEGLTVQTQVSLLYHVKPDAVLKLLREIGPDYEEIVIRTIFRSAARDVSARYMAKDLHTAGRAEIEKAIEESIKERLEKRGIFVEAILLKSITLPPTLRDAIEQKLAAEQSAQMMDFVLAKERKEAERKSIEANGIATYQKTISKELNPSILKFNSIEAFKELSKSNNTKVIITNGTNPILME